jgi:hypothetical protein
MFLLVRWLKTFSSLSDDPQHIHTFDEGGSTLVVAFAPLKTKQKPKYFKT